MQSYVLKISVLVIFNLFGLSKVFSQSAITLWRICNEEGKDEYEITYKLNNACNGTFDSLQVWAKLNGSLVFEKVDDIEVNVFGTFTSSVVLGKKDFREFYLVSNSKCLNLPNSSDTVLVDRFEPSPMTIEMATVINGRVVITWSTSLEVDLSGYELYKVDEQSTSFPIGQVEKDELSYEIPLDEVDPKQGIATLRIAAIDSCGQKGRPDGTVKTIFLKAIRDNPCENILEVKWSDYVGDNWIMDYRRVVVLDEDRNELRDVVLGAGVNQIPLNNLPEGLLSVYIEEKQKNSNLITRSNEISVNRLAQLILDSFYIKHVSVRNDSIDLEWFVQNSSVIDGFEVYEIFDGRPIQKFKTDYIENNRVYSFMDEWKGGIQYYVIKAQGICGGYVLSDTSKNMLLKAEWLDTNQRGLRVSDYGIWNNGVKSYLVERKVPGGGWSEIGSMVSNELVDEEYIAFLDSGICYRVIATGFEFDSIETAMSNTVCLFYPFHGDIPNAFIPDGMNNLFKVNAIHYSSIESSMVIFNRWGERVYETDNPVLNGWNGNMNNELNNECPMGIYVYHITLKMLDGKRLNYTGTLHLIR